VDWERWNWGRCDWEHCIGIAGLEILGLGTSKMARPISLQLFPDSLDDPVEILLSMHLYIFREPFG